METLLDVRPFTFALDVAALASRREYLNLDKWLADNIANHGAEFLRAVMEFLDSKTTSEKEARISEPSTEPRSMALNPQTIAIFLRVLRNKLVSFSSFCFYPLTLSAVLRFCRLLMLTTVSKSEIPASRFTRG